MHAREKRIQAYFDNEVRQLEQEYGTDGISMILYPTGEVLIDTEDFVRLHHEKWLLQRDDHGFFVNRKAFRRGHTVYLLLAREITRCVPSQSVHHKNRDRLDCRKVNLAVYTYEPFPFPDKTKDD